MAKKSSLERITELKRKATEFNAAAQFRKEGLRQHEAFCQWLLKEKRVTREEMKPFFKKKEDVKKVIENDKRRK